MKDLGKALAEYADSGRYPFHMPGHKRVPGFLPVDPYRIDITEIEGFDDLNHPEDFYREMMEETAALYGVKESLWCVNGSSGALLAAIRAAARPGDAVLIGRNCHKAVYNAICLIGLVPYYIVPEWDAKEEVLTGIRPERLKEALDGADARIKAVVITSPTYEGVTSDVRSIARVVHDYGATLIVDEAHGAHLRFCQERTDAECTVPAAGLAGQAKLATFPASAAEQGADLVIQSLHKTMPALTQTALLHRCTDRVASERLRESLRMFQTSSPSYVLTSSMAAALSWAEAHPEAFRQYRKRLSDFYREMKGLRCLYFWDGPQSEEGEKDSSGLEGPFQNPENGKQAFEKDPGKLVLSAREGGPSGTELAAILREKYDLDSEMSTRRFVLLMTSVMDTDEAFERLKKAVREIDEELAERADEKRTGAVLARQKDLDEKRSRETVAGKDDPETGIMIETFSPGKSNDFFLPERVLTPTEASGCENRPVRLSEAVGLISAEYAYLVPPEIPILVPGERISDQVVSQLLKAKEGGCRIKGSAHLVTAGTVRVTAGTVLR